MGARDPNLCFREGLPDSHPFPKDRTQGKAPELGADSSHDLVVAMDQQRAEGPKPIPSQPPLGRQPQGLQNNSLVIRVQILHQ